MKEHIEELRGFVGQAKRAPLMAKVSHIERAADSIVKLIEQLSAKYEGLHGLVESASAEAVGRDEAIRGIRKKQSLIVAELARLKNEVSDHGK